MFFLNSAVGGESKQTQKESLDIIARNRKVKPETLYKLPRIKNEYLYLFDYFADLRKCGDITYSQIKAWCDLKTIDLAQWELDLILELNLLFLKSSINGRR